MARNKKFKVTREVFKIAKSANRLRKALDSHNELLEQAKEKPVNKVVQENTAYERNLFRKLGNSVDKHFYTKVVGVSFQNSDSSSRQDTIQSLIVCQELEFRKEPQNKFDPNAILLCTQNGLGIGYLNERLAGEVTRSLNKGVSWRCYVRRVLHAADTKNWGVTVCMVKLKNASSSVDLGSGISGSEFLAKYYPNYKFQKHAAESQPPGKTLGMALFIILAALLFMIIHSC
ncbi:HIRAN domain-containing protein [Edaphobacter paludis]|uniref:HIRAN domain-containing protein n=1 Tax=Edaphobacter paludis TaxID=3035702 RepID=A0AAU7D4A1_9BACT